jgi:3-deoxy-D-manno-octulosonate 8-phosphate phosphatase KdsC-like HAD superfamily phosphatase
MTTETKNVRAYNVRIGDGLSYWDSKARRERILVVRSTERVYRLEDAIAVTLTIKGSRKKEVYSRWFRYHELVRVRRVTS